MEDRHDLQTDVEARITALAIHGFIVDDLGYRDLHHEPADDRTNNRDLVNVTPLQFGEEVLWIHSARSDEAFVTAALYLDRRDLKSANQCRCSPLSLLPCNTVPMVSVIRSRACVLCVLSGFRDLGALVESS